jgi:hypothetical protein
LAVNRVEALLRDVTRALDQGGIAYAVVGGNAVAAWVASVDEGAVRATKDLDLLVRRADLPRIAAAMATLDMEPAEVFGVSMFVTRINPSPKTGVHLLFGNEPIRPHELAAPDPDQCVRATAGFRVLDLPGLLRMKLIAFRLRDQVHIQDMLEVGLIDAQVAAGLPDELLARLRQVRDGMDWHAPPPEF